MELVNVPGKDITRTKGDKLALVFKTSTGTQVSCLEKDYGVSVVSFDKRASTPVEKVDVAVSIFWLDPQRESGADMYWSKLDNSIKFKVSDGEFKDFVGYLKKTLSPLLSEGIH